MPRSVGRTAALRTVSMPMLLTVHLGWSGCGPGKSLTYKRVHGGANTHRPEAVAARNTQMLYQLV